MSYTPLNDTLYIPFDTETGGVVEESTLLTVHFAICDSKFNIIDELDLAVKPNGREAQYNITARALEINHIDLIEHDKVAKTFSEAGQELRNFLWKYSNNGKIKLIPVGKNVGFDIKKVNDQLLGASTWNQFVSYRTYDITSMIIMVKRKGLLPEDAPESLEELGKYFGIDFVAHTAKGDNYAGIEVVKRLESL
jgi:DNA polymerase III alpha subunit (gram-positive type)